MDDQRDGNYLWEKIGHSQEIVIKYKKLINRLKEASVCCKRGGQIQFNKIGNCEKGEWAGSGTLRGNFGSVGNPTSQSIQYEIFVARKDLEKAQAVMWNLLR